MLAFNVYQRTLVLPAVATGLWALLGIGIGFIFPALYQGLRVTPAQSHLELTSIARNIKATTAAMAIGDVDTRAFPANQDLSANVLAEYKDTLNDVQLWDPIFSKATFTKLQALTTGYSLTDLAIDRYKIKGKTTPVIIGARALNSAGLVNQSWVNTHLQYTQGFGAIVAPANTSASNAGGNPRFLLSNIPQESKDPSLTISNPGVYYAPGDEQYVITNSGQAEVQYQGKSGAIATAPPYTGNGIPVDSILNRLGFAIHLHDFNLLVSNLITSKSRLIQYPDVRTAVQKALPFVSVDAHPYAVINNGQLDWMVDAYVTSNDYPFAQTAPTDALPAGSGLSGQYNYVRDSLKVVVNAYSGKMRFYSIGKPDPILRAYESIFPGLIQPLNSLQKTNPALLEHLRYPQDLLTVQAEVYGRYHVTKANDFYARSAAWDLGQTSDGIDGSPSNQLQQTATGEARFQPIYELLQLHGGQSPTFSVVEPLVPFSSDDHIKNLSAIFVANSSYAGYGEFTSLNTPYQQTQIDGPGLANADINANPRVSEAITLLDKGGSTVTLGTIQILPIADSLLYVRPLYVSSSQTAYPLLQDVLVVYGSQVTMEPTLSGALQDIFGSQAGAAIGTSGSGPTGSPGAGSTTVPLTVKQDIAEALSHYANARAALGRGDLGTYQSEVNAAGQLLNDANGVLASGTIKSAASPKSVTTTTIATKASQNPAA
jgi:hypothetical protein